MPKPPYDRPTSTAAQRLRSLRRALPIRRGPTVVRWSKVAIALPADAPVDAESRLVHAFDVWLQGVGGRALPIG